MSSAAGREPAYRWTIVLAASGLLAIAMGQLVNGLSVFVVPLEAEFGWTRGEISMINTAGLLGLGLGGIVVGFVADRADIRRVVILGAAVTASAALAASRANALWQLYAIYFVAGAFGGGALFAPLLTVVGSWFRRGAGLAIGIVSAGQAIGQGAVPMATSVLIGWLGWRGAFLVLGLVSLATLVPLARLVREAPERSPPPGAAAVEEGAPLRLATAVVALSAAVFCCCTLMSVPMMHLVPLAQGRGIAPTDASGVVLAMMVAAVFGRVAFGRLSDTIGAVPAYFLASAWQSSLVLVFVRLDTLEQMLVFAPIYGFGYGGVMTAALSTIRALTPAARRAAATGIILAFAWAGHGAGGFFGGFLHDRSGGYELAFAAAALVGVVNLVIVGAIGLRLGRRAAGGTGARRPPGVGLAMPPRASPPGREAWS